MHKIERVCNKIPQPIVFFLWLTLITIVLSVLLSAFSASFYLIGSENGEFVTKKHVIKSILSGDGIVFLLTHSISKISSTKIMPILVMSIIGLGIAEGSGYIKTFFVSILSKFKSSGKIATVLLLFFGAISNIASDAGYLVLIPLGAIIFASVKRSPIAGIAVAFAGVSGGFIANLFLSGSDALMAGISTTASKLIIPEYKVAISANYYFSIASTFAIVIIGYIITEYIVIKHHPFDPSLISDNSETLEKITPLQKNALKWGNLAFILCMSAVLFGIIPENGILRNPETGSIWQNSPLSHGVIIIFTLIFGISGLTYGIKAKTIKKAEDVIAMFTRFISLSSYALALVIFAYQFLNILEFTNLGIGFASLLVAGIKALNVSGSIFVVLVIFAVALINLFITGMSSKWLAVSYVLIPTFINLGYTPELAQVAYRIGDSVTNIISPAMYYMPIVLAVLQRYKKDITIGALFSIMMPYSIGFFITLSALLVVFLNFNIPLGPDVSFFL